ncbi:MAG TPA: HD domain-containing phosphohydrolase [Gaiellaceae bacterium]|nr:HD domain-containing phosphohydrolase [Gaiellaceae bacterium]
MIAQHAALAGRLAAELGLSEALQRAVGSSYEQWDGKGWGPASWPAKRCRSRHDSPSSPSSSRWRTGWAGWPQRPPSRPAGPGRSSTCTLGSRRDPCGCDLRRPRRDADLGCGDRVRTCTAHPAQRRRIRPRARRHCGLRRSQVALHARPRAVADLAAETGAQLGLAPGDLQTLRRAGLVHDLGRLDVSNAILDRRGPLGTGEWERVRLHPYLTERMLHQSAALAPLAAIAVQHRERLDGSGYPKGLAGAAISTPARILGAADAYQSMCEPRPYRQALTREEAAATLRAEAAAGRLDDDAVAALLSASGHRVARRRMRPAGLTAREVDVLRLLARGLSNKEIASKLVITPKTSRNHVEHVYAKIGASTRVTASQHGLLTDD